MNKTELMAFDLDGTLTQHKTKLSAENRRALELLSERYRLLMVGAGMCSRIFKQMERYPIDIIGNYGMQYAEYREETGELELVEDVRIPCDRELVEKRITELRRRFGYTEYAGDSVEYHSSGCVTFPLLGTAARIEDKLAFDPDRKKRRAIYAEVKAAFEEYTVFVGGSSSFDMAPAPYDKLYALEKYCAEHGIARENVIYFGDDYGSGGNDESVYRSGIRFVRIDDYRDFPAAIAEFIK